MDTFRQDLGMHLTDLIASRRRHLITRAETAQVDKVADALDKLIGRLSDYRSDLLTAIHVLSSYCWSQGPAGALGTRLPSPNFWVYKSTSILGDCLCERAVTQSVVSARGPSFVAGFGFSGVAGQGDSIAVASTPAHCSASLQAL